MSDTSITPPDQEKLAELQHAIWTRWMKYLFSVSKDNDDGTVTIPRQEVERWKRQMSTDYQDLEEEEKDSDREQAELIVNLLQLGER